MYLRVVVENSYTTFTDFALTELTTGLHCLHCKDDWETVELSDNATVILGTPAETLRDDPTYWISRIHPSDVDAVRGALHTTTEKIEKHISFRYHTRNHDFPIRTSSSLLIIFQFELATPGVHLVHWGLGWRWRWLRQSRRRAWKYNHQLQLTNPARP